MEITVNQQVYHLTEVCSVQQMLATVFTQPVKGMAVAVNQIIVPKTSWQTHLLQPGDQVIIIKATQGG